LANSSPGFERSENPGSQEQEEQTLKALGLCDINPYRVESGGRDIPRVVATAPTMGWN